MSKVIRYYVTEQDYVKNPDKPKGEAGADCYFTLRRLRTINNLNFVSTLTRRICVQSS